MMKLSPTIKKRASMAAAMALPRSNRARLEVFLPGFTGQDGYHWELHLAVAERHLAGRYAIRETKRSAGEVRLNFEELLGIIETVVDARKYRLKFARAFCTVVERDLTEWLGMPGGLKFKRVLSRREYNFEFDVILATLPLRSARGLVAFSETDEHRTLAHAIVKWCELRPDHLPAYSPDCAAWLKKPLQDWDCHELNVLLSAFVELAIDGTACNQPIDPDAFMAFEGSVDWARLEGKLASYRRRKKVQR